MNLKNMFYIKATFAILVILLKVSIVYSQDINTIKNRLDSLNFNLKSISIKIDSLNSLKEVVLNNISNSNKELEILKLGQNPETKIEVVAGLGAKIRSEPNGNGLILKDLEIGEKFFVTNTYESKFLGAESNGVTGFVSVNAINYNQSVYDLIRYHEKNAEIENNTKISEMEKSNPKLARLYRLFGEENGNKIYKKQYWIGMTSNMTTESLGRPNKINKTSGSFGNHEQWIYPNGLYLYFENGILTSYQR